MIITPVKHVNKGLTDLLSANARLCPVPQELMHFDFVLEVPVDVVLPVCWALSSAFACSFVDDEVIFDLLTLIVRGAVEPN